VTKPLPQVQNAYQAVLSACCMAIQPARQRSDYPVIGWTGAV